MKVQLVAAMLASVATAPASACEFTGLRLQNEALAILRSERPSASFKAADPVDLILMDDPASDLARVELGLTNLQAKVCADGGADLEAARELMREHFRAGLASIDISRAKPAWQEAATRLRLQLMPAEYLDRTPLVSKALVEGIAVGVVIDGETSYKYVSRDDARRWKVDDATIFDRALANLAAGSDGATLANDEVGPAVIFVQMGDGFDAARILVPSIREDAARRLGEPFYAGIPNRDFLVMWGTDSGTAFGERVAGLIASDCRDQSHPLSCRILRVWRDGRIETLAD